MNIAHLCSIAVYKDYIYVITGTGVDDAGVKVPNPVAPSLICFNKGTGDVVWSDNSPGGNLLIGQWSSPTIIEINGSAMHHTTGRRLGPLVRRALGKAGLEIRHESQGVAVGIVAHQPL